MYKIWVQASNSARYGNWSKPSSDLEPNVIIDADPLPVIVTKPHFKPYFLVKPLDQKFVLTSSKNKFSYQLSKFYDPDGDAVKLSFLQPLKSFMKFNQENRIITL